MRLPQSWIDDTKQAHVEADFFPSRLPPASRPADLPDLELGICLHKAVGLGTS